VLYLVKYYGGFIYFISYTIKNQLKNTATLSETQEDFKAWQAASAHLCKQHATEIVKQ
jgi:hypothetical protein